MDPTPDDLVGGTTRAIPVWLERTCLYPTACKSGSSAFMRSLPWFSQAHKVLMDLNLNAESTYLRWGTRA